MNDSGLRDSKGRLFSDCYGRGFEQGERVAWQGRSRPGRIVPPPRWMDEEPETARGFLDAQIPRNPAWVLRTAPVKVFSEVD